MKWRWRFGRWVGRMVLCEGGDCTGCMLVHVTHVKCNLVYAIRQRFRLNIREHCMYHLFHVLLSFLATCLYHRHSAFNPWMGSACDEARNSMDKSYNWKLRTGQRLRTRIHVGQLIVAWKLVNWFRKQVSTSSLYVHQLNWQTKTSPCYPLKKLGNEKLGFFLFHFLSFYMNTRRSIWERTHKQGLELDTAGVNKSSKCGAVAAVS